MEIGTYNAGRTNPVNPLDPAQKIQSEVLNIYKDEDRDYLAFLQYRLQMGRDQKLIPLPEFNNLNYYQFYESNEKISNTFLEGKKNDDDVIVSAGTVESKLDAICSAIANLDFSPEVFAYDRNNNEVSEMGTAMRDIIRQSEELDEADGAGDEEKKILRQRELLKQGTAFVQDEWTEKYERKKKLKQKYDGQFKDWGADKWDETLECVFEGASRSLVYGPNMYLGNITEFYQEKQPFMFVAFYHDYDVAKAKFGKFENWKYVKKGDVKLLPNNDQRTIYDNKWRLNQVSENQVEIIIYQDETRDEFQVVINGVLMMPVGFPLSAVSPSGQYNIVKQVLRPYHDKFAYGKPFVASGAIKQVSYLIDEMLKLFVLKTRKSVTPAYINTSGKIIPKKVLSPGRITMGIPPDSLHAIGSESQGVTNNEFAVLKELQERIDKNTVSPQFQGQQSKSNTTATEINELQKQARLTLGLIITSITLLEKKLAYLRLEILLEHWFEPTGTTLQELDEARQMIKNKYRITNTKLPSAGGQSERMVIPTDDDLPDPNVIRKLELMTEKKTGKQVRYIYLNPKGLRAAKLTWFIKINPREKESSTYFKLLFREQLTDMIAMVNLGSQPNSEGLEEQFSKVYEQPQSKLFKKPQPPQPQQNGPMPPGQSGGGAPVLPMPPSTGGRPGVANSGIVR